MMAKNTKYMEATTSAGIDIKKVDELLNDSILLAVKYVKEQTGWHLTDCKRWIDNYRNKKIYGTITWFEIAKGELPPKGNERFNKEHNWSDRILLIDRRNGNMATGQYIFGAEKFSHSSGNWQPTHWAFINYPT